MATYKVIQDIEAEDHILGPLSLRQFIFALIAVFCFYVCFVGITKHLQLVLVPFLPVGLFCAFFAFPFGRDQPTEVWALAKLRFLFKPRRRIWDQSGVKDLVTITAPKKIEHVLTNGLSQNEVESRLTALANTIDSRGWAIKNVSVNAYAQPNPLVVMDSDRLIDVGNLPQEVPSYDITPADDMLDAASNPIAQQFDHLIKQSNQVHHQQLVDELNRVQPVQPPSPSSTPPVDYWFMRQSSAPAKLAPDQTMFSAAQVVQPGATGTPVSPSRQISTPDETALAAELKAHSSSQQTSNARLHTLQPLDSQPPVIIPSLNDQTQATNNGVPVSGMPVTDAAILSLADNNDLNVATIAREAHKVMGDDSQDEVVISLR